MNIFVHNITQNDEMKGSDCPKLKIGLFWFIPTVKALISHCLIPANQQRVERHSWRELVNIEECLAAKKPDIFLEETKPKDKRQICSIKGKALISLFLPPTKQLNMCHYTFKKQNMSSRASIPAVREESVRSALWSSKRQVSPHCQHRCSTNRLGIVG